MKPISTTPSRLAARALSDLRSRSRGLPASLRHLVSRSLEDDRHALALFRGVVEPLSDSFLPRDRQHYDRAFSFAIESASRAFPDSHFSHHLHSLGLDSAHAILARVRKTRTYSQTSMTHSPQGPFFLVSRVTLGADVAVTSILLQALREVFPRQSIHILGGAKLRQLFGGLKQVSFHELSYPRHGGLRSRLDAWAQTRELIRRSGEGHPLVLDPDSRITQLGLLPLTVEAHRHRLFTASIELGDQPLSISQVAAAWIARQLRQPSLKDIRPRLFLRRSDRDWAERTMRFLFPGPTRAMAISLGVGGNESKSLPLELEDHILLRILKSGRPILLDKGAGTRELERGEQLLELARGMKIPIYRIRDDFTPPRTLLSTPPRLVTYEGGPGRFAALLGLCSPYLGYDSLWQHVAAALEVPLVTLFQGHKTPVFAARWRPAGPGPIRVLYPQAPGAPSIPQDRIPFVLLDTLHHLPERSPRDSDLQRLDAEQRIADAVVQDILHHLGPRRTALAETFRRLYLTALPSLRAARHRYPLHRGPELSRLALELAPDAPLSSIRRILAVCLLSPVGLARVHARLSSEQMRTLPRHLVLRHRTLVVRRLRQETPSIAAGLLRAANLQLMHLGKAHGFDEVDIQWITDRLALHDAHIGLVTDSYDASEPLATDYGSTILREVQYLWLATESGLHRVAEPDDPTCLEQAMLEVRRRLRRDRERIRRRGGELTDRPFLGATVLTLHPAYRLYRRLLRRYHRRYGSRPARSEVAGNA